MSTNRVGGPIPPESNKSQGLDGKTAPGQHRRIEKVDKIQEVSEIDEEKKRRQFQQAMDEAERKEEEDASPNSPGPMDPAFYAKTFTASASPMAPSSSGEDLGSDPIASPAYSSPPPDIESSSLDEDVDDENPLPQSSQFWRSIDAPPDQIPSQKNYQEIDSSSSQIKNEKGAGRSNQGEEDLLYELDEAKWNAKKTSFSSSEKNLNKGKKKAPLSFDETDPSSASKASFPKGQKEILNSTHQGNAETNLQQPRKSHETYPSSKPASANKRGQKGDEGIGGLKESNHLASQKEKEEDRKNDSIRDGNNKKKQKGKEIDAQSLPVFPPDTVAFIQTAFFEARPYLNPQTFSLFYQMVGTIHVFLGQTRGIARTEILLNSPAFANSKFFGSTITIEKYATAPDSLNIRLTGSNEAVATFNQNIPSLLNAFQNSGVLFRIGRISAEYETDRPVYRRKEDGKRGEGGAGGGMGGGKGS